jgi:nucleotide-binding universal stress UspA family protein
MFNPKIILAPVDFSDAALEALETAADLATRFGADLLLVHVVPALPDLPARVSIFKEGEYDHRLHDEAVRRVAALASTYRNAGLTVRSEVGVANDVGMEILRLGQAQKADLIVVASHGAGGWKELIFGSVAEKVVRLALGPVLVLRGRSKSAG